MAFPVLSQLSWLIHVAYSFLALSYIASNLYFLRLFLLLGSLTFVLWATLTLPSPLDTIIWNSAFATINFLHLMYLLYTRYFPIYLKPEENELLQRIILQGCRMWPRLHKREFRQLFSHAHKKVLSNGETVLKEGESAQFLGLVLRGRILAEKSGIIVGVVEPLDFFGEFELLLEQSLAETWGTLYEGHKALSSPVSVPGLVPWTDNETTEVLLWDMKYIKGLLRKRNKAVIADALYSAISRGLVLKLQRLNLLMAQNPFYVLPNNSDQV